MMVTLWKPSMLFRPFALSATRSTSVSVVGSIPSSAPRPYLRPDTSHSKRLIVAGRVAHHVSSPLGLSVHSLRRTVRPDLLLMLTGEDGVGQDLFLSFVPQLCKPREPITKTLRDPAPLLAVALWVRLCENNTDRGAHHLLGRLQDRREGVAHEMYPAPLSRGACQNRLNSALEPPVAVFVDGLCFLRICANTTTVFKVSARGRPVRCSLHP